MKTMTVLPGSIARAAAMLATLMVSATALAQAGFAVDEGRDVVSGELMVVLAYIAIWVILLGFVARSWFELRALRREADELKRVIEESSPRRQA
jgi:hypothetical protein